MKRRDCLAALLLSACAPPPPQASPTESSGPGHDVRPVASSPRGDVRTTDAPLPDRADFANALSQVEPGMDADEVTRLVGPPDDVRTKDDPGGIDASRTTSVWRWGTSGHLSFATLGTVHVQADNRVQYVFGAGAPPKLDMAEPALRALLATIDAVPSYDAQLHPLRLVRAVNALHTLGKDTALAVLSEYLRVSCHFVDAGGRAGVFLVLRTLFDPAADPGVFPHMMVGAPRPPFPKQHADAPRFPIVLVDDMPFNVVSGYSLGGLAESPEMHLESIRKVGTLRAAPLAPTSTPLDALLRFVGGPQTPLVAALGLDDADRVRLMAQAALLLESVFPGPFNATLRAADAWSVFEARRAVRVAWSAAAQDYRLAEKS